MSDSVTVPEYTHQFWKIASITCGILCVVLFTAYWNISGAFWAGIFRFAAFIFFAAGIMTYLKIMDGPLEVTLTTVDELLVVSYTKKEKVIQEEQFERDSIDRIECKQPEKNVFSSFLQPDSRAFSIDFNDSDRNLYLFEFRGRPLLFAPSSQEEVINYLENVKVSVS